MSRVVGVDGAPEGWVAAARAGVRGFPSFAGFPEAYPDAAIPVWLGEEALAGRVGHFGVRPRSART